MAKAPGPDQFDALEPLLAGDKAAWDRFVVRFAPVIFAAVHRRLGPAGRGGDAEDVAQDVFIKICNRDFKLLRGYDPVRAKLGTWLTVIANTTAIDHLRRQKAPSSDIDDVPERVLAVHPKIPERFALPPGVLSARQALVLELLYRRDLDVKEAADILGIDPQTIRSTHHKALTKLRNHFKEENGENVGG